MNAHVFQLLRPSRDKFFNKYNLFNALCLKINFQTQHIGE